MPDDFLCIFLPACVSTFHIPASLPDAVASNLETKEAGAKGRSSFRQCSSDASKPRPFLYENRNARQCPARPDTRNRFEPTARHIFRHLQLFARQQECQ